MRSTTLQLLNVLDQWTEGLEQRDWKQVQFIQISRNPLITQNPHKRLIEKVKNYEIKRHIMAWIKDLLNNGRQRKSQLILLTPSGNKF